MKKIGYTGKIEDLAKVGNVKGKLPLREIYPFGCSDHLPGLVLKGYGINEKSQEEKITRSGGDFIDILPFLDYELRKGNLEPLSGLGFLMLSSDILNVCRWGVDEYKDIIFPQIYTFEKYLWVQQRVEKVGAFCSAEERVNHYETKAWLRYLNSKRTNKDKMKYLNDFLVE